MALIEAWWGNTTWSSDLKFSADAEGPVLHVEGGAREPSTITWRHYVAPDRMTHKDCRALSVPTLLLKGPVSDVLTKIQLRLTQRVFLNDIPAGAQTVDYPIATQKLPNLVQLGPLSFPPLVFLARKGQEIRVETEVVLTRTFKDSRPYSPYPPGFLAVVPQWGLILDVPT